jgi:cGMP-dependent protein kinase
MKLVRTYKTQNLIFFMLEYIPGKVMSKFLQNRSKSFINNTHLLTFYLSSILIILSYLNSKGICHRDLKPDNIMIDEKGYLKLLDFGTSIELTDFTHTITGTPHYIAPEIMLGKGYGFSCDYWSTGIIAHELYFGYQPFGKGARDPIDVYREIIKKDLHFSKGDPQVIAVIKALLNKKVSERICSLAQAKQTELLIDFKWNELEDLRMKAPFVPKVSNVKEFNEYNVRYIHYIRNEIEGGRKEKSDSLLSSYQSDNNNNNDKEYISNWADVF